MAMGSGLLALTMAMVAADGPSCPPVETTTYQVRVLTLDGLDWRTSSYTRLQPVAHQGTSMIWTADRALAASLADRAKGASPCHTIMAVGEAVMTKAENVNYIASMDRVADGPVNQSSAIAFMPRPEQVEERFSIKVAGRKLDQGVLTRITLEETHIDVIHGVPQTETLVPPAAKSSKNAAELGREVRDVILTAIPTIPQATSVTSSVQIPEVTRASVTGEWLIPNDGVLIVSLGVKTAADDKGMAVVRERVAVIEACSVTACAEGRGVTVLTPSNGPFQHTKLGQPVVPGRSMPEAVDPNGNLVDLPPLPEALASADLDRIKPEPYQPSPQSPSQSAPSSDPALARTSFDAAPTAPKAPTEIQDVDVQVESGSIQLSTILDGLAKAGVKLVVDIDPKEMPKAKAVCEKCDDDLTYCPAAAGSMKAGQVAGGMKLVPESSPQIGVKWKVSDGDLALEADLKMDEALKMPGKTETTVIPLGGNFSLELKATVVPTSPDKEKAKTAVRKDETPASQR
jgi:hypothetical protein